MFSPQDTPRVFKLPIGVDFSTAFVDGFFAHCKGMTPAQVSKILIFVNSQRARRRISDLLTQRGAFLLPKIRVVTEIDKDFGLNLHLPPAVSTVERRLALASLVAALIDKEKGIAARGSVFALADSLSALVDEMLGEDVAFEALETLSFNEGSEYWNRSLQFLKILTQYWSSKESIDPQARQKAIVNALDDLWNTTPHTDPIIVAGSTGSRKTTAVFMRLVSRLPNGAVILPGVDTQMPRDVETLLAQPKNNDDHPQSMLARFTSSLDLQLCDLPSWQETSVFNQARNRITSLALRPAPVTDQWMREGPDLISELPPASQDISLILASSPMEEATSIAACLRKAAQDQKTAVLISPDRMLTRRVTATLKRWKILPDDSAGAPLHLTPIGLFLRLTAQTLITPLDPASFLALTKQPLCHSADGRNEHLRQTRQLEMASLGRDRPILRGGPPLVSFELLGEWAQTQSSDIIAWVEWFTLALNNSADTAQRTMADWMQIHLALAERLHQGVGQAASDLWENEEGKAAYTALKTFDGNAYANDVLWSAADYAAFLNGLLTDAPLRNSVRPHPYIVILGTLEARVQGADLVILGGLNEGIWPKKPAPDPWLNRSLRKQLGLLLPERNTGLSAHDFQQAFAQKEVVISRALRDGESPTVASRWVTRLENLMTGLGDVGTNAWAQIGLRGDSFITLARHLDRPKSKIEKAKRPAPVPDKTIYPRKLSVTQIKTLIRDPYAIYARSILDLKPLNDYASEPDYMLRGTVLHAVIEAFLSQAENTPDLLSVDKLLSVARQVLDDRVPWAAERELWYARLARVADSLTAKEQARTETGTMIAQEIQGRREVTELDFMLSCQADRIDRLENGDLVIYDYKSGDAPTVAQTKKFDKQLYLEAAIAQAGGFKDLAPATVAHLEYISLKNPEKPVCPPINDEPTDTIWQQFTELLVAQFQGETGYGARMKMEKDEDISDYDHLSRLGEWDPSDDPDVRPVP